VSLGHRNGSEEMIRVSSAVVGVSGWGAPTMFGLVYPPVISAIIGVSFFLPVSADNFTNPPTYITANGTAKSARDLSTTFTLGQTVQITWATSLRFVSLTLTHWDVSNGIPVASFLS
jgi:hypothetical protein